MRITSKKYADWPGLGHIPIPKPLPLQKDVGFCGSGVGLDPGLALVWFIPQPVTMTRGRKAQAWVTRRLGARSGVNANCTMWLRMGEWKSRCNHSKDRGDRRTLGRRVYQTRDYGCTVPKALALILYLLH